MYNILREILYTNIYYKNIKYKLYLNKKISSFNLIEKTAQTFRSTHFKYCDKRL
jgi:hypothetical protein